MTDCISTAILLAVHNGADFLEAQLMSLSRQSIAKINVWVSDDGSKDSSNELLVQAARGWSKGAFHVLSGPCAGFAENFRFLIATAEVESEYVAFCDQDDVWDEDKLADAVQWLAMQDKTVPALFCSRTRTMTADGVDKGYSPLFERPPTFQNAMVQSIAGANTMVMNYAAWQLVREASRRSSFVSHDWWCYLLVSGVGGNVFYSPQAKIAYRQHRHNLVGANTSWRARADRLNRLMKGTFMQWSKKNLASLEACEDLLSADARDTMRLFAAARSGTIFNRIVSLRRSCVYRQTALGQISLYVACILNRL